MPHRILLVVPANNTTMEREISELYPADAPVRVARVPRPPRLLLEEDLPAYGDSTLRAVEPFVSEQLDIVMYGCTAAGFLGGLRRNFEMVEKIRQKTGAPVVSTAGAMVDIIIHEGLRAVTIVSPYVRSVNESLVRYFAEYGIAVEALASFDCATTEQLGRIDEQQVYDLAAQTIGHDSKSLFIACSQLPTLGILSQLRARLGIPVWSSIAATARMADLTLKQAREIPSSSAATHA